MQNIKYLAFHLVLMVILYVVYALLSGHNILITQCNLNNWDVWHYLSIRDGGYYFNPQYQSNVAFFPAFPYLWKFSGLNIFGISVLNIVLFYSGMLLLAGHFRFLPREILLSLAVPSMMFMYIPYSEALFFLAATVLVIGLSKQDNRLVILGFFLCSVTRSAANVFLPAIIIMELVCSNKTRRWLNMAMYIGAVLAGVLVVALVQYLQTGEAFGFLQTQKNWDHKLSFPDLPLWTWGDVLKLDGAALFSGLAAAGVVIYTAWKRYRGRQFFTDRVFLFAALYIAGVTLLALSFKQGGLFSLNRYVFPTVFFVVFLPVVLKKFSSFNNKQLLFVFLGIFAFSSVTVTGSLNPLGIFGHIQTIFRFLAFVIYIFGFFLLYNKSVKVRKISFAGVYLVSIIVQIYFMFAFLDCAWVG